VEQRNVKILCSTWADRTGDSLRLCSSAPFAKNFNNEPEAGREKVGRDRYFSSAPKTRRTASR
jgi:hypothetical protein